MAMKTYTERKERARNQAIEWQRSFPEQDYSQGELAHYGEYFYRIGKRCGLLKELRENGIA